LLTRERKRTVCERGDRVNSRALSAASEDQDCGLRYLLQQNDLLSMEGCDATIADASFDRNAKSRSPDPAIGLLQKLALNLVEGETCGTFVRGNGTGRESGFCHSEFIPSFTSTVC